MRQFQVGQVYSTGGYEHVWQFKVTARTAKFITIENVRFPGDAPKRVGVKVGVGNSGSVEWALPLRSFALAPVISA